MKRRLIARKEPKVKIVAKVRRSKTEAYGTRSEWMELREKVLRRDGRKCRKCPSRSFLQVDHIIPIAKGGKSVMSNLWTLCATCHAKRPGHKRARGLILSHTKRPKNAGRPFKKNWKHYRSMGSRFT